jgi:hypothetical protein
MPKQSNVLVCGADIYQAIHAYLDGHPLDHDDDVEAERGMHAFEENEEGLVNSTQGLY